MNRKLHFLLFLMPLSVLGQNYTLYPDQSYHTISGVSQNLLNLDVFVPNSGETPKPVMVYIHGGSWSIGDKSAVGSKAEWFTDSNYVFVSINYRLSPEPADTLDANRIKFPDHSDDVGKAMAWVIENIGNYQGDTSRISVIGHSAGAHLALLVSTDPSYLNNEGYGLSKIKCSCALDAGAHHINYYMENYIIPYNQTVQWLTYVNAFTSDPTIWSQASPYTYLQANAGIPELLLVHQGTAQRIDLNQHFGTQAEAMGIPVTYFNADPMTHEQINQALGHDTAVSVVQQMNQTVSGFFSDCLADVMTNIRAAAPDDAIQLFPNPAHDQLWVRWPESMEARQMEILSLTGQLLLSVPASEQPLDISSLPAGVFILRLRTDDGIISKRMIKY